MNQQDNVIFVILFHIIIHSLSEIFSQYRYYSLCYHGGCYIQIIKLHESPSSCITVQIPAATRGVLSSELQYLSPQVKIKSATSISTILLVNIDVGNSYPYIYICVSTLWAKHSRTIVRRVAS